MSGSELRVKVWRGGEDGAFQHFAVARRESQTVLDVVTDIQRQQDPTLSYRYACRVGMCGSCAMTVNGEPRWTCRTRVAAVADDGILTIEPLRNLPKVRDLVVDMVPFFDKWQRAQGSFEPGDTPAQDFAVVRPDSAARKTVDAGIECIGCGVCYSACDVVTWDKDYLGPAALNRAWTLVNDVRDQGNAARLDAVTREGGCQSCHSHMSCTTYCPKSLSPTYAIAGLKRAAMRASLARPKTPEESAMNPGLFLAQRVSAMVLALAVLVHLTTILYAAQSGMTAGHVLARTHGNLAFFALYVVFVLAAAVHAPIGLRNVLREWLRWSGRPVDIALVVFAGVLVVLGLRAAFGMYVA